MMDDVTWQIAPNEGLLPVRFGDTPDAVAALPGMPVVERSVPQFGGGVTEQRGPLVPSIGYAEGVVTYIACASVNSTSLPPRRTRCSPRSKRPTAPRRA